MYAADSRNAVIPGTRFDSLLAFLKDQEAIYEQLEHLKEEEPRRDMRPDPRHARTRTTKSNDVPAGCVVCGDGSHRRKLYFCKHFRALNPAEKNAAVEKLGACERCLELHDGQAFCKPNFLCKRPDCRDGSHPEHHYYLCPNAAARFSAATRRSDHPKTVGKGYTADQEDFISKLPSELAEQCRDVFSNSASKTLNTVTTPSSLLARHGLRELPVLMMLLEVTANAGQQIGTLIDLASDTNYITHKAARRLNLKSEKMSLVVHGVGGMKFHVETRRYLLKIRVKTPKGALQSHQLVCYGLDNIADVHKSVTAQQLQRFFPDVPIGELERPKKIDLLISHREGKLVPQRTRVIGDLVLWDGPLGKTVGGAHPDLFEDFAVSAHTSSTHFARSMRTVTTKCVEFLTRFPKQQLQIALPHHDIQEPATILPAQKVSKDGQTMTSENYFSHLRATAANMECILKGEGLQLKPWMCSGQSGRQKSQEKPDDQIKVETEIKVPSGQMGDGDNKPLDQAALLCDPGNFVTPAKQNRAVLAHRPFQGVKSKSSSIKDAWDAVHSEGRREDGIGLLKYCVQLCEVKFFMAVSPTFSDLPKLVEVVACVLRAAKVSLEPSRTFNRPKWEVVPSSGIGVLREMRDVLCNLMSAAQDGAKHSRSIPEGRVSKEQDAGLLVCGRRVQSFRDHIEVRLRMCDLWVRLPFREPREGLYGVTGTLRGRVWWKAKRKRRQRAMTGLPIARQVKITSPERKGYCPEMSGG